MLIQALRTADIPAMLRRCIGFAAGAHLVLRVLVSDIWLGGNLIANSRGRSPC